MKDKIREKLLEEFKVYDNGDFNEVCQMENEYPLEYVLVYLWQNGSYLINELGEPLTCKEFDKLFTKDKNMKLYRGMHLSTKYLYKTLKKILSNKYLSFSSSFKIAQDFATPANIIDADDDIYSIILSCETDEYIDADPIRSMGEKEFIIRTSNKLYKIESLCKVESIHPYSVSEIKLPQYYEDNNVIIHNRLNDDMTKEKILCIK